MLPKRTSFERLTKRQCAVLMSHINSKPRPSLGGLCAIQLFQYAYKDAAKVLLSGLGIEETVKTTSISLKIYSSGKPLV